MDEARAACAIDVSGPAVLRGDRARAAARATIAGFEHEAAEEFFRAVASAARLTLHLELQAGHERAPHDRGLLQGVRARAADRGRDRPRRGRRAVDEGDADVTVALVDYGMGNRRSVEKALEHVGARVARTADRDEIAAADAIVLPGVGAFPEAMRRLRALGLDELVRERAARGRAAARHLPRHAAAVRRAPTSTRAPPASGCCRARSRGCGAPG